MNVYQKLNKCRLELQGMNLKKSGENKFAKYFYYELGDFLPTINVLFDKAGLFAQVNFGIELAELKILNVEKPEDCILFTSPMSTADLKGCHEVQNLGAVQTYLRRYLYTVALEIVEHDALDATTGSEEPPKTKTTQKKKPEAPKEEPKVNKDQRKHFFELAGNDPALIKKVIGKFGYSDTESIPKAKYSEICVAIAKELDKGAA